MKLEINYRKNYGKRTNMYTKQYATDDEIKEEIRKYFETNENGNITFQNLWDAAKAVLRGNFIAIQSHLKNKKNLK